MKKYFVGIDSGSTMCKTVLYDGDGETVVDTYSIKTGWNPGQSAKEALSFLLDRNSLDRNAVYISATGYGREAIDFADHTFTEITCHAFGGMFLAPDVQGIIDIGGQDSKVIQIHNGKVVNFFMNDKCAAGTGRFLSMACDTLGVRLEQIDGFADLSDPIPVNSMCTVFAESEMIGLLAMQKDRAKIMAGVLQSIAQKIFQMTGKINFDSELPLLMTGGLSCSEALIKTLNQTLGLKISTHDLALFAGAIGACICAAKREN